MSLIGNGVRLSSTNPMRQLFAPNANTTNPAQWRQAGAARNAWASAFADTAAFPYAYTHPNAWHLPPSAGPSALHSNIDGEATFTAAGAMGVNGEAALSGSGSITNADLALVVYAIAALTGSGSLTDADLEAIAELASSLSGSGTLDGNAVAFLNAVAALSGSGTLSGEAVATLAAQAALSGTGSISAANLAGVIQAAAALSGSGAITPELNALAVMVSALSGSGSITGADLEALANAVAALAGVGSLNLTPYATGELAADITLVVSSDAPTADQIAAAVWQYILDGSITDAESASVFMRKFLTKGFYLGTK